MLSIVIVTVAAPVMFARDPNGPRGVKRMLLFQLVFNLLYLAYVTLVHTEYYQPHWWRNY